jgi:hypothetical protein
MRYPARARELQVARDLYSVMDELTFRHTVYQIAASLMNSNRSSFSIINCDRYFVFTIANAENPASPSMLSQKEGRKEGRKTSTALCDELGQSLFKSNQN